jgi:hypothetical protein
MNIQVETRSVYGNELVYPVCDRAKLFAKLTKTKTLNSQDLRNIKDLGYTINRLVNGVIVETY